MMFRTLCFLSMILACPANADVLAEMQGTWSGSGWLRETGNGAKETVRCRLKNTHEANVLTVKGRCVVPGRKITLSGEMRGKAGSNDITGHWFNPNGLGSVRVKGVQRARDVSFSFRAEDPETGADIARNVEWHTHEGELRLRVNNRDNAGVLLSEINFSR